MCSAGAGVQDSSQSGEGWQSWSLCQFRAQATVTHTPGETLSGEHRTQLARVLLSCSPSCLPWGSRGHFTPHFPPLLAKVLMEVLPQEVMRGVGEVGEEGSPDRKRFWEAPGHQKPGGEPSSSSPLCPPKCSLPQL